MPRVSDERIGSVSSYSALPTLSSPITRAGQHWAARTFLAVELKMHMHLGTARRVHR